jgi:hypothetical protein
MPVLPTIFDASKHAPWLGDAAVWHDVSPFAYDLLPAQDMPDFPEWPVGLVGEVMRFIFDSAPHPMREAAIIGGLGFIAGIVGRAWNVESSGLNDYFTLIAPSASGKNAATEAPEKLISEVSKVLPEATAFIGPGDVSSKAALARYLSKADPPSFTMFIPEIGEWLEPIVSPKASEARQSLRKMLLDLSEKAGKGRVLRKSAYADSANNIEDVKSPAVTIVGDSNPATFFEIVTERNTANGFFARIVILQNSGRVADFNAHHAKVSPSRQLIENLASLCAQSLNLNHAGTVQNVEISDDADAELSDFRNTCAEGRDHSEDDYKRAVWGRAYVHALRISAVLAVGRNPFMPTISIGDARWSISLVTCSVEKLLGKFEDGEVGNVSQSEVARLNEVRRVIRRYISAAWPEVEVYAGERNSNLHSAKIVPYGYIQRSVYKLKPFKDAAFGKSSLAVRDTIRILIECGELTAMSKAVLSKDYRYSGDAYMIERPEAFLE